MVALSTTEAEYVALSLAAQLTDLQIPTEPIVIEEDNQGALALARNPIAHSRTKHIDIRFHFIRKALEDGIHLRMALSMSLIALPLRWLLIYLPSPFLVGIEELVY